MKRTFFASATLRAFSLIEVILAVGVIAILLVVSVPALGRARENAKAAICTQNLRRIGVGLAGYMAENSGKLVPYASLGGSPQKFWFDALDKFMDEEPDQFDRDLPYKWQLCPSKAVLPKRRETVGYGWNHRYLGYTVGDPKGGKADIRQIVKPSETVVIADSQDINRADPPTTSSENRYLYSHQTSKLAKRHNGKGFYLMLDGHVMAATPEEIVDVGTGPYRLYWKKTR